MSATGLDLSSGVQTAPARTIAHARPTGSAIAQALASQEGEAPGSPPRPRAQPQSALESFTENDVSVLADKIQQRLLRQTERMRERQGWPR